MSETGHTPGPWDIFDTDSSEFHCEIRPAGSNSYLIARVSKWSLGSLSDQSEAVSNARLIAAAPDMLAALQNICANAELGPDMGEAWHGTVDIYKVLLDDIETARAAIAKATGTTL